MARSDYWIKVFDSLPGHWKVRHVQEAMGWNRFETVGFLVMFWLQVASDAPDGVLDKLVSVNGILKALGLKDKTKKAKEQFARVVSAMLEARLLEVETIDDVECERAYALHDWEDGGGKLQKTRTDDTVRQRNYRSGGRNNGDPCHADVTRESKSKEKETPPNPPQAGGGFRDFQNLVFDLWAEACGKVSVEVVRDNSTTRGIAAIAKQVQSGNVTADAVGRAMANFLRMKYSGSDAAKMATWGVPALAKSLAAYIPKASAAAQSSSSGRCIEMRCDTCGYVSFVRLPEGQSKCRCCRPHVPLAEPCSGVMEEIS